MQEATLVEGHLKVIDEFVEDGEGFEGINSLVNKGKEISSVELLGKEIGKYQTELNSFLKEDHSGFG